MGSQTPLAPSCMNLTAQGWKYGWKISEGNKKGLRISPKSLILCGVPKGVRTPVTGVRGRTITPALQLFQPVTTHQDTKYASRYTMFSPQFPPSDISTPALTESRP